MQHFRCFAAAFGLLAIMTTLGSVAPALAQPDAIPRPVHITHYRFSNFDGLPIFYREAGAAGTSSHMFRNLIPALSDRYHVAPDYPASV